MSSKKRIFISPLDWGLGHATRCIPVIKALIKKDAEVIIGAEGISFDLLSREFPKLPFIKFPGYQIKYSKNGNMLWQMAKLSPKIINSIRIENRYLKEIVAAHRIDGIISDNRYGLYHNRIPSAFITHQLYIKSPFGEKLLKKINKFFIEKHLECWIPDFDNPQKALSGELSHPGDLTSNIKFIGPLSRFSNKYELVNNKYELLVILSGPEPQRSIFEKLILNQLQTIDVKTLVVLGNPSLHKNKKIGKIEIINHLPTEKLQIAINQSEIVLARSGYTTVMDLASLGKKAILIPTPGQTEQQYLAELHMHKGNCVIGKQKSFSLNKLLEKAHKIRGFEKTKATEIMDYCITEFLNKI